MPHEEDHEHLTLAEAARLLGMPPKTLERWARAGRIANTVMASPARGQRMFYRSELLRLGGRLVAEHRVVAAGSDPQWLPEHRAAAEAIALGRHGRPLRAVSAGAEAAAPRPELHPGEGDYDVEVPDLDLFEPIGPHPDIDPADEEAFTARTEGGSEGCGCFGGLR